jgi:protein Tex
VSAMSRSFVSNPRDVVKPGDIVRVKVLGVDIPRKRISLTLRLDDDLERDATGPARAPRDRGDRGDRSGRGDRGGRGQASGERGQASGEDQASAGRDKASAGRDKASAGRDKASGGRGGDSPGSMADALRRAGLAGGTRDGRN